MTRMGTCNSRSAATPSELYQSQSQQSADANGRWRGRHVVGDPLNECEAAKFVKLFTSPTWRSCHLYCIVVALRMFGLLGVSASLNQLKQALAHRYSIDREIGRVRFLFFVLGRGP